MKKSILVALSVALILGFTAFKATNAGVTNSTASDNTKSVAWYVANLRVAKEKNKECYNNPGIQSSPDCLNSRHALEISFKGGN